MLDACDLVAGCTVVFGKFGLDDDLWIEFIGDHEVRCLVEAGQPLSPSGFPKAYTRARQDVLDGVLDNVSDQFAKESLNKPGML